MIRLTNRRLGFLTAAVVPVMYLLRVTDDEEKQSYFRILLNGLLSKANCTAGGMVYSSDLWFTILIPLLIAVPFLFPLEDALQGGCWRLQVSRTGIRGFLLRSHLSNLLAGSSFVTMGYAAFVLLCYICLPNRFDFNYDTGEVIYYRTLPDLAELGGILLRLLTFALACALTASFCMLTMQLTKNKFRGIGIPMILNYLLDTLSGKLVVQTVPFDNRWELLSPSALLSNTDAWFSRTFSAPLWLLYAGVLLLILLLNAASAALMKRRVRW
jgi:hypothetical protein